MNTSRKEYRTPVMEDLGSAKDLIRVGQTRPGGDLLPGQAEGQESGSILPGGLN